MAKLGMKPAGGAAGPKGGGSSGSKAPAAGGGGSGKGWAGRPVQQQQPKSAFEAAFGSVIQEMESTAGAQAGSRCGSSAGFGRCWSLARVWGFACALAFEARAVQCSWRRGA